MENSGKKGADGNRIIDEKLLQFFNNGGMMRDGYVIVFDDQELNRMLGNGIIFPTEVQAREFVADPVATPFAVRKVKVGLGIPNEVLDEMQAKAREASKEE
jgi:hypothetical protein